jgi:hypothetical protein
MIMTVNSDTCRHAFHISLLVYVLFILVWAPTDQGELVDKSNGVHVFVQSMSMFSQIVQF